MATLFISEFGAGLSTIGTTLAPVLPQPALADQIVALTDNSVQSAAFGSHTRVVLIVSDMECSIRFGDDPEATTESLLLPSQVPMAFGVIPGQKVAAIVNS